MQGPGKKWEHYDLNKNGKPVRLPMHVQRGDMVQIISGAEKGKTGKITNVKIQSFSAKCSSMVCMKATGLPSFVGHHEDRSDSCRRCKSQGKRFQLLIAPALPV